MERSKHNKDRFGKKNLQGLLVDVIDGIGAAEDDVGGGVVKPHFRLGVHNGSWVTDP